MKSSWKHLSAAAAVVMLLAACGGGGTSSTSGSVQGTLTRASAPAGPQVASQSAEIADIVPGQIFVAFEHGRPDVQMTTNSEGLSLAAVEGFAFGLDGGFSYKGVEAEQARSYPTRSGLALFKVDGLDVESTRALVDELRATSTVSSVFPNWILEAQQVAVDDEFYDLQAWHYEQLNLPAAWAIETGESNAVPVVVLDAGAFEHPDIKFAATGANFVRRTDGSRDPSEGDVDYFWSLPNGTDHGLHVAGTIAAHTDNGVGVAGVNWIVTPTQVKVLGASGAGTLDGIIEGVYWAAGYDDPTFGGHINPDPARVINMSLGGMIGVPCPPALDQVFKDAYTLSRAITVVAAGNDAGPADPFFPASCPSVITVGATGPTGARADYSGYGAYVDVFAPGGDVNFEHPADSRYRAAVVSTTYSSAGPTCGFKEGTSMAAPHVAGVVSLMLAREPDLSLEEVRARLINASRPLTLAECNVSAAGLEGLNLCGAGLLDAEAALLGENLTADNLSAVVYAVPYEGAVPDLRLSDLGSLETLAAHSTVAQARPDGSWSYRLTGLPAGDYLIVGLEQLQSGEGVGMMDRFGVEEVTVVAGQTRQANIVATPVWTLR